MAFSNKKNAGRQKAKDKKEILTKVHIGVHTNIALFHKIFIGTCYLLGVVGIISTIMLVVVTWPQLTEKMVLTGGVSSNSVTLSWTAPGDDNSTGRATEYDIRYATFDITEGNWSALTQVPNPPVPKIAGSTENFEVTGLEPDTVYYFAIKTSDEIPNWSALSNVVSKKTAPAYICSPQWSCNDWSICENGYKTRRCIDLNNCGDDSDKPVTRLQCDSPPNICTENWVCAKWSSCTDGLRTRNCIDKNDCDTTKNKPKIREACEGPPKPPPDECDEYWLCGVWSKCQNNLKTRKCIDVFSCGTNFDKPRIKKECTTAAPEPEICNEKWSCTDWADCSKDFQRRECQDANKCTTEKNRPKEVIECAVGGAEPEPPQEHYLAVTPSSHGGPHLKLFAENLSLYSQFFAYAPEFRNGVNPAIGDLEGDGSPEIIAGTGPGSAPHLRVFDKEGNLKYQFFAYPPEYRIGISVATGDVDGDGRDEIITAPQERGGPHVRVFKYLPDEKRIILLQQFFAYPSYFRMGVNVASGDLNNDGLAEIIVAPRNRGGPHVRIFQLNPVTREFNMQQQFFAYDFGFRGGVSLAVGDVDNDGINEIITGAGPGGGPHVRIFNNRGNLKYQFFAASNQFRGGLDVAALDYDHDGAKEVVTSTYSSGLPGVKVFKRKPNNQFEEKEFFFVYDPSYQWGIRVAGY